MRCRHRLSKLLLRHGHRFDDGPAWTQRHRDWLAGIELGWPAAQATMLDARGAIDALAHRRDQLEREIAALLPGSPWAIAGRPVALPARHRHAHSGRAVRGDRRLRALRARRAADELRRPGAVREHDRPVSAAWARSRRPAPGTPAGCWSRPPGTTASDPRSARRSPSATTASPPKRSRSPGARSGACIAPGPAWRPARSAARSSPSPPPASSPASAGRSAASSRRQQHRGHHPVGWVGGGPARAGNPRDSYEHPPRQIADAATPDPRQRLPTTNPWSCGSQPAHISLTARRAQPAGPPPTQPTAHQPQHPSAYAPSCRPRLDNHPLHIRRSGVASGSTFPDARRSIAGRPRSSRTS